MEEPLDIALEDVCNFLGGAPDGQQPGTDGTGTASGNLGNVLQDAAVFQSLDGKKREDNKECKHSGCCLFIQKHVSDQWLCLIILLVSSN